MEVDSVSVDADSKQFEVPSLLRGPVEAFRHTLEIADSLRGLMSSVGLRKYLSELEIITTADVVFSAPMPLAMEKINETIHVEMRRKLTERGSEEFAGEIAKARVQLQKDSTIGRAAAALAPSSAVWCWTAFECLAKDVWIACVNAFPKQLAYCAMKGSESESSLDAAIGKSIPVRLLSKYDFDLRSVLGDILCKKFDFTGVSGIDRAYSVSFQTNELSSLFNGELRFPEAVRHLIVHRAGRIDEEFVSRSNGDPLTIGTPLILNTDEVGRLRKSVAASADALLLWISNWIACHTQS